MGAGVRRNTGQDEQAIRAAVIAWMAKEKGTDVRVIHELALGERRIDLLFVYPADIVGVEIKGPRDSLGDGRMSKQLREYSFWLPEVWLAVDVCWEKHATIESFWGNLLIYRDGAATSERDKRWKHKPTRDEMCCSRLLDLLWNDEVKNIGNRTRITTVAGRISSKHAAVIKGSLARLLTGHEIMKNVCSELRSRPLTGIGSDAPMQRPGFSTPAAVANLFDAG